jgi:hypothetical protein
MAASKGAANREKTYYIAQAGVGNNVVGDPIDVSAYGDKKLKRLIEDGYLTTEAPEDDEVEPTDEADATLEPARRSGEATGQPNPDEEKKGSGRPKTS